MTALAIIAAAIPLTLLCILAQMGALRDEAAGDEAPHPDVLALAEAGER